jgi:SAM-dependent methyltransferase
VAARGSEADSAPDDARADVWAVGDRYEPYVGRWSRLVARQFLAWLDMPEGKDWLDVGCGTGALTQAILDHAHPAAVTGIDPSAAFVAYAQARVTSPRASFGQGDAQSLLLDAAAVDAAVAGLSLNFVPQPALGVAEMTRVVRAGGVVAAYVWDYAGRMDMMRCFWDAAASLEPAAQSLDEGTRFPLCQPEPLKALFGRAGLRAVRYHAQGRRVA